MRTQAVNPITNGLFTRDEYIQFVPGGVIRATDKTTGRLVWEHRLSGEPVLLAKPELHGNLLMVLHGTQRAYLSVFNVRTRKLLGRREVARTAINARMNEDGLLLLPNGHNLELLDPRTSLDEPIWALPLEKSSRLAWLDEKRFVLAVPTTEGTKLEVRGLLDCSRVLDTFVCRSQPRPDPEEAGIPTSAGLPRSYGVLHIAPAVAMNKDKLFALGPKVVQAFTSGRPEPVWTAPLPTQADLGGVIALGDRYVEVSLAGVPPLLWEAATGKPVKLADASKAGQESRPCHWWATYHDRLIVAGNDGVVVYGPGESAPAATGSAKADKP